MRDHSETELRRKLALSLMRAEHTDRQDEQASDIQQEQLNKVIQWCQEHGWQDDARFTERFIASRARKGFGPQRIRMELAQRGVEKSVAEEGLAASEVNWLDLTYHAATKKFGEPLPTDWQSKAKVQRFLIGKGFISEDIREIFRNFAD